MRLLDYAFRRLDHVVVVNDINVSMMDQRSVIEILANSQHLKMANVEFENGVYINRVNETSDSVLRAGTRVVHVNHLPVYDAHQVERLIQKLDGPLTIGLLRRRVKKDDEEKKPTSETLQVGRPKHKFFNKVHEKLFGRASGASAEKARAIIAQANIDASARDLLTYRHGSLRLPSSSTSFRGDLCRTASLRGPPSTRSADGKTRIQRLLRVEPLWGQSSGSGCTWPSEVISSSIPEDVAKSKPSHFQQANKRRSMLPVFSPSKPSPSTSTVLSDYSSRPTSAFRPIGGESAHLITSPGNLSQPSVMGLVHAQRVMGCSPSLPQPPPYPGPKSSVDSLNITSTSSFTQNNSSSFLSTRDGTTDSITNELNISTPGETRTVYLPNESGKIGLELEDSMGGVVVTNVWGDAEGKVHIGEQLIDICGINMRSATKMSAQRIMAFLSENNNPITLVLRQLKERPRRVSVLRKSVELCGGNVTGILIKNSIGPLRPGDRILQLDDVNTRGCTLAEAVSALERRRETMVSLLVQHDYERYVRLQNGTEGDGFYVRVNINRAGGSADELDLRIGDILFVDNTLFMGTKGRWRAWRIDQEGRQRQCGIIPSEAVVEDMIKRFRQNAKKWQLPEATPIYEHIERVAPCKKRPLILFGAFVDPFLQRLLDEHPTQFAQCVPEFLVLSTSAADVSKNSSEYVEIRRRDKLFEVITHSNLHDIMNHNLHCVMEISPQAVARLHSMRIYPILIRIKFKTVKQMKELSEDIGERLANKQAKERFDKAKEVDNELEQLKLGVNNVIVSSQANYRNALRHICLQIVSIVEHEQKRTVWVPKGRRIPI
uniref:PDZ domain-containing protein n=1 Tax=Steinernema glaseri TaxID=37863 RepID=A0A1I8AJK0_9BILA